MVEDPGAGTFKCYFRNSVTCATSVEPNRDCYKVRFGADQATCPFSDFYQKIRIFSGQE